MFLIPVVVMAQRKNRIAEQRDEEMRYFEVKKSNTQFNVISPIKQIV